jgi:hypothetical protein
LLGRPQAHEQEIGLSCGDQGDDSLVLDRIILEPDGGRIAAYDVDMAPAAMDFAGGPYRNPGCCAQKEYAQRRARSVARHTIK